MDELKAKLVDWYNRNIVAGWYASAAVIGGWLTAGIAWLPDIVNWLLVEHAGYVGNLLLPTMDAETKAVFMGFYLAFIQPPLRAKIQTWMQKKSIKQQADKGQVVPLKSSGVAVTSLQEAADEAVEVGVVVVVQEKPPTDTHL